MLNLWLVFQHQAEEAEALGSLWATGATFSVAPRGRLSIEGSRRRAPPAKIAVHAGRFLCGTISLDAFQKRSALVSIFVSLASREMLAAARCELTEAVLSPRAVDMVDRRSAGVWRRRKSPCYGRFMRDEMWKTVHAELTRLARAKGEYDAEEARWLVAAVRLRVHEQVGYATPLEYLERLFGYGPRMAKERLRVAEALAGLPAMRDALAAGALTWSAVRELSRVAVAGTEAEWLAAARGKTARQIEEMVPGRKPGDRPSDPAEPVTRHVLRLELSA